jgi:Ca2+-binding RTX toxin-like protein
VFYFAAGTAGTFSVAAGTGADSGKLFVMRTDGSTSEAVMEITTAADGTITVKGIGSAAYLGTDTVKDIDHLLFSTVAADPVANPTTPGFLSLDAATVLSGGYATLQGVVADGLIAGATVFRDANGNGQWDAGEAKAITAADGSFTLSGGSGALVAIGGTNTDTGLANMLTLRAPDGSTVVNPLTTLVAAVLESAPAGTTAQAAAAIVAQALGISPTIDLLKVDVFSAASSGDTAALEAQKAAATIVTIIAAGVDAAGSQSATDSMMANLADIVLATDAGSEVDLTDQSTIHDVLEGAVSETQIAAVSSNLAQAAEDIANATDLQDLSAAQGDALTRGNDLDNVLTGGSLNDELLGFGGNDQLSGNGGDDRLDGGAGDDRLDGGGGVDTAVYSGATAAVTASLLDGKATGGAGADTLVSIENIIGSSFADKLTGDAGNNTLDGGAGNDALSGGAGDDLLVGGAGSDRIDGGVGSDTADYSGSSAAISINLASGKFSGGDANGDILVGIENVTGSRFDDKLIGDQGANVLVGGAGNDTLNGGGGADVLWGGAGADQFVFKTVGEVGTGVSADQIMDFEAGGAGAKTATDRIDLSAIDAIASSSKDDAFTFIGDHGFGHKAGELQVVDHDGVATISGDIDGDGRADFTLMIQHTGTIDQSDFIF